MIFNSLEYALFLPVVFFLYWFVFDKWFPNSKTLSLSKGEYPEGGKGSNQLRWQNAFVLVASYVFYGWWSWKFLVLIAFTSLCSYLSGRQMATGRWRKTALWGNILVNLAVLGLFKYYDFFATELAGLMGVDGDKFMLHLVLPVPQADGTIGRKIVCYLFFSFIFLQFPFSTVFRPFGHLPFLTFRSPSICQQQ